MGKPARSSDRFPWTAFWVGGALVTLAGMVWLLWIVDAVRRGRGLVP